MNGYWSEMWSVSQSKDYIQYINPNREYEFIKLFKMHNVVKVCDAACGFGKYSVILSSNDFCVSGFDIADNAVKITLDNMRYFALNYDEYRTCSITDISFQDEKFDAVIAHAVLDHLRVKDARIALSELDRIIKPKGFIYLSFDGLNDDDLIDEHEVLAEGEYYYTKAGKKGMLFKYYSDQEIQDLLSEYDIIYYKSYDNGEREIIVQARE